MEIINHEAERESYRRARKKVKGIKGFYYNLLSYCIVIPILVFINLYYVPEHIWFYFPMLGWGTGLMFHGFEAFGYNPVLGKNWEEKKVQELLDKERKRNNN